MHVAPPRFTSFVLVCSLQAAHTRCVGCCLTCTAVRAGLFLNFLCVWCSPHRYRRRCTPSRCNSTVGSESAAGFAVSFLPSKSDCVFFCFVPTMRGPVPLSHDLPPCGPCMCVAYFFPPSLPRQVPIPFPAAVLNCNNSLHSKRRTSSVCTCASAETNT
jgi:hypothetical protein